MKGLDDGPDGLNDAAFGRALDGDTKRKRASRKPATHAAPLVEARRVFTGADPCMACGRPETEHAAARIDRACPVTADSLTADQVDRWWRAGGEGGSFVDALDASPELRARAKTAGLYYPAPSAAQSGAARTRIAAALNQA